MTKRRNPFPGVTRHVDRHGKVRWRLRRNLKGRKVSAYLPGAYGSEPFRAAYEAALEGPDRNIPKSAHGTFDHLIEHYLGSKEWRSLRDTTKVAKRGRLDWIREKIGEAQFADLQPRHVATLMDLKDGPFAANRLHKELGQLYRYATRKLGYTGSNPTSGADRIKTRSKGFHSWTVEQVEQFRAHHCTGTMARLAFEIALGTGAARQDVARMGFANIRDGALVYVRGKTGGRVQLPLALMPELARELGARSEGRAVFITTAQGKPYTVAGFGNWFRGRVEEAGLPAECSLHGLRKHGAARLAELGATEWQIMAFLGHESPHEARRYVAAANRATMAADALRLLQTDKFLPNLVSGLDKMTHQDLDRKAKK